VVIKVCPKHGETDFAERVGTKGFRCRKCIVDAVTKRRKKVKEMAVAYKGGKCQTCGFDRSLAALTFHHRNPDEKSFTISGYGHCRSWAKVKAELDKCDLLCANCHAEQHSNY